MATLPTSSPAEDTVVPTPPSRTFCRQELWTVLALVLNAAGFGALYYALAVRGEPIRVSVFDRMAQWTVDIDKAFVEYPELRPYFYSDKRIEPDDPNFHRATAVAELMLDTMDSVLEHEALVPGGVPHKGWDNWIDDSFTTSPIMREQMGRYAHWLEGSHLLKRWENWKKKHPDVLISESTSIVEAVDAGSRWRR